ncbi:FadR/GntR family transcriptional regulator [Mycobacterium sp.]|uniref:FadR/GntR family transcriptional regulator n=1 Tax=Mycobacterium sp. TaxID=1785 RepID=UPI002B9F4A4C|nr:FCD domain-containing protein [Mycobacterium sp.]HTQ22250.1 FCD domain-containing protein [Mycobacterium sp.]
MIDPIDLPGTVSVGPSRAEMAANQIALLAAGVKTGDRIGSKDEIRQICGVSVGTFNEAIKLAQERGVITSRPGPGGGIFACDPSPLARMNVWFRSAAQDESAVAEAIQIRDAIAPVLVDEALAQITADDRRALAELMQELRCARDAHQVSEFVWAAWNVHARVASVGKNQLLDSLYLSIINVGTSHLHARLESGGEDMPIYLDDLAEITGDLVEALDRGDRAGAIEALRNTDPTMVLRPPAT